MEGERVRAAPRVANGTRGRTEQGARPSATRRTNAYQSERCLAHAALQPSYTRKQPPNVPALSARTLTLLVNRFPSPPHPTPPPRHSTRIHGLEDRRCVPFITGGEKSARHRPYPNSDDFVRRLSTISPLSARRQEEAAAPISQRNETRAPFWFLLVPSPPLPLFGSCSDWNRLCRHNKVKK